MKGRRGVATVTTVALVLALLCAGFAVRAVFYVPPEPAARPLEGLLGPEHGPAARALTERLARGMIALQRADGGFDLGPNGQYSYLIERVASTALATAALAALQAEWTPEDFPPTPGAGTEPGAPPAERVPGLAVAVALGLDYLKRQQTETGAIGREEVKDHWSQVDATAAGILAFAIAGRPEDAEALRAAGKALTRFARAGLRNGWTRALGVMTADRLVALDREDVLGDDARAIADWRRLKQQPGEGLPQPSDWNVAEAISRVVLGLVKGQDVFPGRVVLACLEDVPAWTGQSSDCQAWWMQSWLVARSGSEEAPAWFAALLEVLAEEAVEEDDTIHGGWYANTLSQSAGAILALLAGLTAQVVAP